MRFQQLEQYLHFHGRTVNQALHKYLPPSRIQPSIIHEAMRYSVNAGGKRLRPILVIAAAELCGSKADRVMPTACAMELIHTYSLVHDDLPAMDNDDLRRGLPTSHKVFGEDIAILTGDALLTHAFSLIAENARINKISPEAVITVLRLVSTEAGTLGMIGGQVADIKSEKGKWRKRGNQLRFSSSKHLLQFIHLKKTAALIRASLLCGGILAGGSKSDFSALDQYGTHIGLAFQITDDILDRIGDKKKLGKKGSDAVNQKLTYPALYGLSRSEQMAKDHIRTAKNALRRYGTKASVLLDLADFIQARDH